MGIFEIYQDFRFESAHHLASNVPIGHPYSRIHGHSFRVRVCLHGTSDATTGWVIDLGILELALADLRSQIDHNLLNDVPGLECPTLENISKWVWEHLHPQFPSLFRVEVHRDSCGHGCVYMPRS
nr:6-carboxytetrahydropterin synthase [Nitrospirillum amazonense]